MRMVSMRGKPPALAPLDGRGKQAQQDETEPWHTIQIAPCTRIFTLHSHPTLSKLWQTLTLLYYGLMSAEAEESILDSLACQKSGPFAGIGTQSLTIIIEAPFGGVTTGPARS